MSVNDFSLLIQDVVAHDTIQVQQLARKLGKPYTTLLREANPYDAGAKLGADTLLKIMEVSRDVRPLEYMACKFGMRLIKSGEVSSSTAEQPGVQ